MEKTAERPSLAKEAHEIHPTDNERFNPIANKELIRAKWREAADVLNKEANADFGFSNPHAYWVDVTTGKPWRGVMDELDRLGLKEASTQEILGLLLEIDDLEQEMQQIHREGARGEGGYQQYEATRDISEESLQPGQSLVRRSNEFVDLHDLTVLTDIATRQTEIIALRRRLEDTRDMNGRLTPEARVLKQDRLKVLRLSFEGWKAMILNAEKDLQESGQSAPGEKEWLPQQIADEKKEMARIEAMIQHLESDLVSGE